MIDWTASMSQSFEFYSVDPDSWKDVTRLTNVKSCTISWDSEAETLGSATFDITESVGESYIRIYLIAIQNGVKEKIPMGTFLAQTPTSVFDGRVRNVTMDGYSPLLELKEKQPALGYYIPKGEDIMDWAYRLTRDNIRAGYTIVAEPVKPSTELTYDFVADTNNTWLNFISDLLASAYTSTRYLVAVEDDVYTRTNKIFVLDSNKDSVSTGHKTTSNEPVYSVVIDGETVFYCVMSSTNKYKFELDEMGHILFAPEQDTASLSPVWTYTDDNSSILCPQVTMDHDIYGIPNVVEVLYSDGGCVYYAKAVNNDPNSPISTHKNGRGREITYRVTNPTIYGSPTQERVDEYAEELLRALSSVEYTITYTHGYCPVRVGDCVRINYSRAGLVDIKAKVISQSIKCSTGCQVTEKAVYTTKLWG